MGKLQKNETGFSVVEVVLVILIVALIGAVGWLVYKNHHKTTVATTTTASTSKPATSTKTATTTPSQPVNPYAGWDTATLKYEQITYQYPSNWTVTDNSTSDACGATPGSDYVILTSPNNEQVILHTGITCVGDQGSVDFGTAIPITALGQNVYIAFENWAGEGPPGPPSVPQFACLGATSSPNTPDDFTSKNINLGSSVKDNATQNSFCYYPYEEVTSSSSQPPVESVSSIENSPDFATAKLIFESMKY
jgi:Tfp pilus assembly major pilin PilA